MFLPRDCVRLMVMKDGELILFLDGGGGVQEIKWGCDSCALVVAERFLM